MLRSSKPKKCRAPGCSNTFIPSRPFQKCCCFECEVQLGVIAAGKSKAKREKAERKETREKLEAMKPRRYWIAQLKKAAHRYVRLRDEGKPCISCGRPLISSGKPGGDYDAGHYRSVGSAKHLEFDVERNIHGQCKHCNRDLCGNPVGYRFGLVERIGLPAVEALEADQEPRKLTVAQLKELRSHYDAKSKELERVRESVTRIYVA